MLELTSIAATSSSGMFSAAKFVIACGVPSSKILKSACFSPAHEPAVAVGDDGGDLDDVDVDRFGDTRAPRVRTLCDEPPAVLQRHRHARMWCSVTRSPASHSHSNGGLRQRADLTAVGEEQDLRDLLRRRRRLHDRDQADRSREVGVFGGGRDADAHLALRGREHDGPERQQDRD